MTEAGASMCDQEAIFDEKTRQWIYIDSKPAPAEKVYCGRCKKSKNDAFGFYCLIPKKYDTFYGQYTEVKKDSSGLNCNNDCSYFIPKRQLFRKFIKLITRR